MSKRKLNRRQAWRVERIQSMRSERAARRDQQIEEALTGGDLGSEQRGLVIAHYGKQVDVEYLEGSDRGEVIRCHLRTHLGQIVTGDRVVFRPSSSYGVIVAADPRSSELKRPNNQGELKTVAANIDAILIVIAVLPHAHTNLIDRYLVASELAGIEPVIVLNKVDLLDEATELRLYPLLERYQSLGYPTLRVSMLDSAGIEPLAQFVKDKTTVFVGQSGVGKSSLINTLLPDEDLKTAALSETHQAGRHTTTTARLLHIPTGGDLIDSPGIREFGLWHIDPDQLMSGFRDLREYQGACRFRNCQHEAEPGCALQEAVERGDLSEQRFLSFLQIRQSMRDSAFDPSRV